MAGKKPKTQVRHRNGAITPRKRRGPKNAGLAALNVQQLAFIDEYMKDLNATEAMIRAGYSIKSATQMNTRMLENPVIAGEVAHRMRLRADAAAISTTDVLTQLKSIVFMDLGELVDDQNRLRPIKELPESARRALSGFDLVTVNGIITGIKPLVASKAKHMELLMRHMNMLGEIKDAPSQPVVLNVNYGAPSPPAKAAGMTIEGNAMTITLPKRA